MGIAVGLGGCGADSPFGLSQAAYTKQCATDVVEGIDVYSGDGTINWTKVKASGRGFAFIKATQGNYNNQTTFVADWAGSRAAGLTRSAYHFYDPTRDGVEQANFFLAELAKAGGMDDLDLPPTLDAECPVDATKAESDKEDDHCEFPAGTNSDGTTYPANDGWASEATISSGIFAWLDTVEKATGRKPIIYSYPSWFASIGFTDARLVEYPLYMATVASCAEIPAPWTSAVFWQYSSSTTVPGLASPGDVDRFFGTADQLASFVASTLPQDGGVRDGGDGGELEDAGGEIDANGDVDGGMIRPEVHSKGCAYGGSTSTGTSTATLAFLLLGIYVGWRRRIRTGAGQSG